MANTRPLTDAISQLVTRATDVATDPQVRSSIRRLGADVKGLGGAVVDGWRSSTARPTSTPATPPGPAPAYPAPSDVRPPEQQGPPAGS